MDAGSPVSDDGRGLKLPVGPGRERHRAGSPVSDDGRGLKQTGRDLAPAADLGSPVSDDGCELKQAPLNLAGGAASLDVLKRSKVSRSSLPNSTTTLRWFVSIILTTEMLSRQVEKPRESSIHMKHCTRWSTFDRRQQTTIGRHDTWPLHRKTRHGEKRVPCDFG